MNIVTVKASAVMPTNRYGPVWGDVSGRYETRLGRPYRPSYRGERWAAMVIHGSLADGTVLTIARSLLVLMRLVMFSLALGLTIISYQAYSEIGTKRLESAFIGFAFISMGMGVSTLNSQITAGFSDPVNNAAFFAFQVVETIPFIVGFAMLYISLYR